LLKYSVRHRKSGAFPAIENQENEEKIVSAEKRKLAEAIRHHYFQLVKAKTKLCQIL